MRNGSVTTVETNDTIFALASGGGRAGVAVYRLSGPAAGRALVALAGRPLPPARRACRVRLADAGGEPIDHGLALWFPAPASYTGEDVGELHLHGGPAVAAALSAALLRLGLRPAEPGEFSRRAFSAGKLDLTQAEAIADLVAADTAAQRRQALRQMDGALARRYEDWRSRLLRGQAHLEAEIDFGDEDLPAGVAARARCDLAGLADEIAGHLADHRRGERMRDGLSVAIVGAPNVGKSTLLNCLAGREAAIVSANPGTTRDVIEVALDLSGYPVLVADTAGLREADESIEEEGVRRARARAASADLRLVVFDASRRPMIDAAGVALINADAIPIINKRDAAAGAWPAAVGGQPAVPVSALTGDGVDALLDGLAARAAKLLEGDGSPPLTRARHRALLGETEAALRRAVDATLPELAAEDVRVAVGALGRITGRVDVEDMLDLVFGEFCIGK
jgi:tRNA modification GTPase